MTDPATEHPFIELRDVRKVYRSRDGEVEAIRNVTMSVNAGELVSIVGPSGCGKSTLLKILAGLHQHDEGEVRMGSDADPFDPSRDIGMVFQQPLLLKWRRILENILLPAEILGLNLKASRDRARELLELVGLADYADSYPYQLSGGMQQRAAIARALVHDPKLVLMDEPFGALDAMTRDRLNLELLRIWRNSGKTILFVTHGIQEAVFLGSHVAVMTARPARLAKYIKINLPEDRKLNIRTSDAFGAYTSQIYQLLDFD